MDRCETVSHRREAFCYLDKYILQLEQIHFIIRNKLAKARKTRKSPGTLGFKKFGPGKLRVQQIWGQNIFINFLAAIGKF